MKEGFCCGGGDCGDSASNEQDAAISLTPRAIEMVTAALKEENLPDHGLRVAVAGGGCSGLQYVLDFSNARRPGDSVFSISGLKVYLDMASAQFLKGTEIDYVSGEEGSGFKFDNPNPMGGRCCGCG